MFPHFPANLKRLRFDRGWTQTDLAARCGFCQSYISQLERGLKPSALAHVEQLAHALGVEAETLLGRHEVVRAADPYPPSVVAAHA